MSNYPIPFIVKQRLNHFCLNFFTANKRRKKQGKEHDRSKPDRSDLVKNDVRDTPQSNKSGNKSGVLSKNASSSSERGGAAVSSTGGKKSAVGSGGNSAGGGGAPSNKRSSKTKRSSATSAAANERLQKEKEMAANAQKDDSDEIDLSTIEIDPDEPTYC